MKSVIEINKKGEISINFKMYPLYLKMTKYSVLNKKIPYAYDIMGRKKNVINIQGGYRKQETF